MCQDCVFRPSSRPLPARVSAPCLPADSGGPAGGRPPAPREEKPQECPSCPHVALRFPSSSLQPLPGSEAPARCETPLPLGRRLGWPWGLFWEPLLRSNGLVRATLTFLSWEEGRTGGGGAAGRWTAPHTHGVEKGARALQEFRLGGGWDGHRGELPLFETDWGPFHPTPSPGFSKGSAFFL